MAGTSKIERIAYHEAGHAVIDHLLKGTSGFVSIKHQKDGTLGFSSGDTDTLNPTKEDVVIVYAGYAARVHYSPKHEAEAEQWSSDDNAKADWLLSKQVKGKKAKAKLELELRQQAKQLIERNWHLVDAIARELLERKTLDDYEVDCIVMIATGEYARTMLRYHRGE